MLVKSGIQAEWTQAPIWSIWRTDKCLPLVGNGTTIPQPATSSLVSIQSGILRLRIAWYHLFSSAFTQHFQKVTTRLIMSICLSVRKTATTTGQVSLNTLSY